MANTKTDTDKDLLFSKLLPALNNNPFSPTYQGGAPAEPLTPESAPEDAIAALRNKLFARSADKLSGTYTTINIMEHLIPKYIDQAIRRFNSCTCDRCRCDVAAHALNNLPPKYTVVATGNFSCEEDPALTKKIMDALVNAVIYVRSHPGH